MSRINFESIAMAIGIVCFLAMVALLGACNEVAPVEGACADLLNDEYDAAIADAADEIAAANGRAFDAEQIAETYEWAVSALDKCEIDMDALAQACQISEQKIIDVKNAEYAGLYEYNRELVSAIGTIDPKTITYNCDRGLWSERICLSYVDTIKAVHAADLSAE